MQLAISGTYKMSEYRNTTEIAKSYKKNNVKQTVRSNVYMCLKKDPKATMLCSYDNSFTCASHKKVRICA